MPKPLTHCTPSSHYHLSYGNSDGPDQMALVGSGPALFTRHLRYFIYTMNFFSQILFHDFYKRGGVHGCIQLARTVDLLLTMKVALSIISTRMSFSRIEIVNNTTFVVNESCQSSRPICYDSEYKGLSLL